MRLSYDPDADTAYLSLPELIAEGRLLGIEILAASLCLPSDVLAAADPA